MLRMWRIRDIRLYLIGCLVSFTGSYMQTVGIAWHIYQLTHSAFYLGILGIVGFTPTLIAFLPAGFLVDKSHKKNVLLYAEVIMGVLSLVLFFFTQIHHISVWLIFSVLFFNSMVSAIEIPARAATVPLIAPDEHLNQALNSQTLVRQVGSVVGPALAGFCIALYGVQSTYLLNGLSFFFFFAMILFIHIPRVIAPVTISLHAVVEGMQFIKQNSLIGITMILDFLASFFAGAMVLLPVFAKTIYHVDAQQLGLLYAAPALGAIIAGIYFSAKPNLPHQGKILLAGVVVYALGTIGFGLSKSFLLGFMFLAIIGIGDMISTFIRNIIRQRLTPDTLRGRVLSVVMVFFMGGPYLGDTEAGFVAGLLGAPTSVVLGGVLALVMVAGIALKMPNLRKYQGSENLA